jgi:hypothetical protein
MRKICHLVIGLTLIATVCSHGDGGAVLARQTINGIGITVLATPVPLRAGPADISVLVQEGEQPVLDAMVEVTWRTPPISAPEWVPPCCTMDSAAEKIPAIRARSNNKFLYSAIVPLKSSGQSELLINVRHGGQEASLTCDIEVRPPLPRALAYWPWLVFPPLAIAGFAIHQTLVRSRQPRIKTTDF